MNPRLALIAAALASVGVTPTLAADEQGRPVLLRLDANPQFVVQPLLRVAVGGEVVRPNLFNLPPETSVAQAVAQAGGATQQGQLDRVRLIRGGRAVTLDLTQPGGAAEQPVRSGDQIVVDRRSSTFRDVVGPLGSVVAAVGAVASVIVSSRRH